MNVIYKNDMICVSVAILWCTCTSKVAAMSIIKVSLKYKVQQHIPIIIEHKLSERHAN